MEPRTTLTFDKAHYATCRGPLNGVAVAPCDGSAPSGATRTLEGRLLREERTRSANQRQQHQPENKQSPEQQQ
jgi:hypothetical protein